MNDRRLHTLNAMTGIRPPMYIHVTRRRHLVEVLRYENWLRLRGLIGWHRVEKRPKLVGRMTFNKQFWVEVV